MPNWSLVYTNYFSLDVKPKPEILINNNFTGRHLIVFCGTIGAPSTWQRAGCLQSFFDDSNIGRVVFRSNRCQLNGHSYIGLSDWEFQNSFQFKPVPWLINIQIKIWTTTDLDTYDPIRRIEERVNDMSNFN